MREVLLSSIMLVEEVGVSLQGEGDSRFLAFEWDGMLLQLTTEESMWV